MITLNYRDARPIYEQVRDRAAAADRLRRDRRPGKSSPRCARWLVSSAINPNTIQRAYSELESEGYAASVPGKGSFAVRRERAEDDGRPASR